MSEDFKDCIDEGNRLHHKAMIRRKKVREELEQYREDGY